MELESILNSMLLPEENRDCTQLRNVDWMLRNLGVQNRQHPQFARAIQLLKAHRATFKGV